VQFTTSISGSLEFISGDTINIEVMPTTSFTDLVPSNTTVPSTKAVQDYVDNETAARI